MNWELFTILAYVALQLLVGFLASRTIATQQDYLIAGRRLGYGLAIFTIFATWFGAETCVSSSGAIAAEGLSPFSIEPFGYGFSILVMGVIFAAPLWRRGLLTLADFFRQRYTVGVERTAAVLMAPTSILWAAAQVQAFGHVLSASSGLSVTAAIGVASIVVIIYTTLGGLLADAVTDLIQGLILVVGLVIIAGSIFVTLGGFSGLASKIDLSKVSLTGGEGTGFLDLVEAWAIPICGSVVAQELVARVIATRSPVVARRSACTAAGLYILIGLIPATIGLYAGVLVPDLDPELTDQVLPHVARIHLPRILGIVFSGALLSAILSTVDSALLAAASLASQNIVVSVRPGMSDRGKLLVARGLVVAFGAIAFGLALTSDRVSDLVEEASAFGTAGTFTIVAIGLATRWGGARSAYAALGAGMGVWIIGRYVAGAAYPYLLSLAAAVGAYAIAALVRRRGADPKAGDPVARSAD
ncbi:MAG: sodium:solute symporter family protein [Planctomycetes bacterium]|nr:sodium:solute symporter family protein [Planctomycetota bacterium]